MGKTILELEEEILKLQYELNERKQEKMEENPNYAVVYKFNIKIFHWNHSFNAKVENEIRKLLYKLPVKKINKKLEIGTDCVNFDGTQNFEG